MGRQLRRAVVISSLRSGQRKPVQLLGCRQRSSLRTVENFVCNLYSTTTNQAAIIALFRVMNQYVGNLPPMRGVLPASR